jgi:hypothetical protein
MEKLPIRLSMWICLFLFLGTCPLKAQVGIGTVTPNESSVLHVDSTTKGLLTPRMTTAQRTAITTPADGLIVYDTTLKSFYHYNTNTSSWIRISSDENGRLNYKLIKSTDVLATVLASELAAGGGTKYLLNSSTYYEINGTINVNLPIDLNNAYLVGLDATEDKLVRSGNLFVGTTGGTVKNISLTVTGGAVFALAGASTQSLIFRDSIVTGCASVGTINGFGLVFFSVIQYTGNTTGITFTNITRLLLSNTAWFGNNTGTFEKFDGTFSLIQKQGGFCEVNNAVIGVDVSSNPTITGDAVMESVVFTGTLTTGAYVKGYTTGSFTGYNFNNAWNVRCAGIPTETDSNAIGEFSVDYPVGSGDSTPFTNNLNPSNIVKVQGTSASSNLFRFSTGSTNNRLTYLGKKKRLFEISGSISFQVPAAGTYIIYVAKNGTVLTQYKIYGRGLATNDILVLPITASVELSTNDYVEIFAQRYTGSNGSIITPNMTIIIK